MQRHHACGNVVEGGGSNRTEMHDKLLMPLLLFYGERRPKSAIVREGVVPHHTQAKSESESESVTSSLRCGAYRVRIV
jgi:hypothetical protein